MRNLGGSDTPPFRNLVNSPAREFSPTVSKDGLTIFWSENPPTQDPVRNGRDADIYRATRTRTDSPFTNVRPLGVPVNSASNETAFYISPDWPAPGSEIWFTRVVSLKAEAV